MTTNLVNFVATRQTPGDLLNPAEYRSIVELIRGILSRYNFSDLSSGYAQLLAHIADHHNPHHDGTSDLFNVFVEKTYNIYVYMTAHPMTLADFKTRVVPTMGFFELIRRIILNRYLYDQVKTSNGSVPAMATATLTGAWLGPGNTQTLTLSFGSTLATEIDFIKLGWGANTTPIATIFDATALSTDGIDLPIVYETTGASVYLMTDTTGNGFPFSLPLASNDFTIKAAVVGTPTTTTPIFSFRNNLDVFQLSMGSDRKMSLSLNGTTIIQTANPTSNGLITLEVVSQGIVTLSTIQGGKTIGDTATFTFTSPTVISSGYLRAPYEDFFTPAFGLRDFTVFGGVVNLLPTIPPGYVLIVDSDGSYLTDYDGTYLIVPA